jgi:Zn ribbon nucleic-acid-binding protein
MEPDENKSLKATETLQKAKPGFICPFCHTEDLLVRQVRSDGSQHALAIYDPVTQDLRSVYPVSLLTCGECGYCMPFLDHLLDEHLEKVGQALAEAEDGGDDAEES